MSISQGVIAEIQKETDNTRRMLAVLSDEHLSWTPHTKSMTLGALAGHIVELHNWLGTSFVGDGIDFLQYVSFRPATVTELKAALEDGLVKNIEVVGSLTDENWAENWKLSMGDHVILSLPKSAGMRFMVQNHLIHHRGQLSVYLRMLDLPLPGIYGPSADERQG